MPEWEAPGTASQRLTGELLREVRHNRLAGQKPIKPLPRRPSRLRCPKCKRQLKEVQLSDHISLILNCTNCSTGAKNEMSEVP